MVELQSLDQHDSFPKSKWGIPEPPEEILPVDQNAIMECIDLILLPGVAFDAKCNRLGHGKGYYDSFLSRLEAVKASRHLPMASTVGMSLREQLIAHHIIPMEEHDKVLDLVVTADQVYDSQERI